jgi:chaperone required for assembly of F1-ATPase
MSDAPRGSPIEAARRLTAPPRQKRFYTSARMEEGDAGHTLTLDGRRAMTPGGKPLAVPLYLADAVAAEWEAQEEFVIPATMPVTRLANTAIDGVASRMDEVRAEVLSYAGTDLVCYRAGDPEELVERQRCGWDPILAWAERRYGVRLMLAEGIVHVRQPDQTLTALARAVEAVDDPFWLAGLHLATTLTGSALIALALAEGELDPEAAWSAAHVDEDWNISRWGEDAEAMARRAHRFADFRAAALALRNGLPAQAPE